MAGVIVFGVRDDRVAWARLYGHMLTTGETYREAGGDYFNRLDPAKQTRRLVAQLERLGHTVTPQESAAA